MVSMILSFCVRQLFLGLFSSGGSEMESVLIFVPNGLSDARSQLMEHLRGIV